MSELLELATAIQNSSLCKNRRYHLRKFKNCLVGRELVDWFLLKELASTRADAVRLGKRLVLTGILKHVVDDHDFEDAYLFYRLALSEMKASGLKYTTYLEDLVEDGHKQRKTLQSNIEMLNERIQLLTYACGCLGLILAFQSLPLYLSILGLIGIVSCVVYNLFKEPEELPEPNTQASTRLRKVFESLNNDSISEGAFFEECQYLKETYAFITPQFIRTTGQSYMPNIKYCVHVAQCNLRLITEAKWSTICTERLRPCLDTGFQVLLPSKTREGHQIFFIRESLLDLSLLSCSMYQQASYLLLHKAVTRSIAIVDFRGLSITEFRKIKSSEIAIGKFFLDCSPVKFHRVYFVNVPWWIKLIKALIPRKHLGKLTVCKNRDLIAEFGADILPVDVGGNLEIEDDWPTQLDMWKEEEENVAKRLALKG